MRRTSSAAARAYRSSLWDAVVAPSLWEAPTRSPTWGQVDGQPFVPSLPQTEPSEMPEAMKLPRSKRGRANGTRDTKAEQAPTEPADGGPWPGADRAPLVWGVWPSPEARLCIAGDPERRVFAFRQPMECGAERPGVELVRWERREDWRAERCWVSYDLVRYLDVSRDEQKAQVKAARAAKRQPRR